MSQLKNSSRVETNNTRLRKNNAKNFIESELITLKNKYKFYSRLITCVHNPNNITTEEAWEKIYFDLDQIKQILSNKKYNILFSVLTVEIHEENDKKFKKVEKEVDGPEDKEKKTKKKVIKKVDDPEAVNLKGFPHIHAVVFFVSPDGKITDVSEIVRDIRKNTSFSSGDDIRIDGGSGEKKKKGRQIVKNDENFLCYVIKNANHKAPFELMQFMYKVLEDKIREKIKYEIGTENCFLIDNSNDKDVIDFVKGIRDRGILIHIPEEKVVIDEVKEDEVYVEHVDNAAKKITKKEEGFKITLAAVIYYMKKENLRLYKNSVFQKIKGSRRSWEYWGDLAKIFGCLAEPSNEEILLTLLENKGKIVEISEMEDQKFLPQIEINWFFVEFKDFYLHLPTYLIIKSEIPDNIACCFMNDTLTLKKLKDMAKPERWLSTVLCQPFARDNNKLEDFFFRYYAISLPLIQKAKVMCLLGPPNTFKSSTMEPINRFFPKEQRTQVTEGKFSTSDIIDKRVLGLDDTKGKALESANMLQLLEGGRETMIEKKFKSAVSRHFTGNVYICTNSFPNEWTDYDESLAQYVLKEQFETRLAIFKFETKANNPEPGFMKKLTSEEIGKVILFTGNFYAKKFLKRDSGILFADTYDECKSMLQDHEAIYEFQSR